MKLNGKLTFALCLVSVFVVACPGGGDPGKPATITGTAATGAPIVGKVIAIDVNGKQFTASTSATGAYTVNVAGGTAPFILTVVGTSGGKTVALTSVATAANQTVNITPLTDLIVSTASGQPSGASLVDLCTPTVQPGCTAALIAATGGKSLNDAVTAVSNMIAPLNTALSVTGTDPLNGVFTANGTGMDAVLEQILVAPAPAQGGMATVTLIAVPGATLGTVNISGGAATVGAGSATGTDLTNATTAASSLSEILACLASFNALYSTSTMPTALQVTPFIDSTFSIGQGLNQAAAINLFSTPATATAGTNGGFAYQGLTFTVSALSDFDFSKQTSAAGVTTAMSSPALNLGASYAWVKIHGNTTNFLGTNFKMVKGSAYTGCAGGWKMAGVPHVQIDTLARVTKNTYGATTTYTRSLSLHIETNKAIAEGIGSVVVDGPGMSVYSGNTNSPVGAAAPVTLVLPPVPALPAIQQSWFGIQGQLNVNGSFYGNGESIQSCQDLAATAAAAGTPCYDETAVGSGTVFTWTAYDTSAIPAVLYAFPNQIFAVPMSVVFAKANDKDLFAQNISASPSGTSALNNAAASFAVGANMDGVIKFSYTVSSVYGSQTNTCGIGVTDASNVVILQAEQNADHLPTQQTSCTFNSDGISGSLAKPSVAFGGTGSWMYVTTVALGNMAVSSRPY